MVVSSIKTNSENDNKRNDTLITFNLSCAPLRFMTLLPFLYKMNQSPKTPVFDIICLFKSWIQNISSWF